LSIGMLGSDGIITAETLPNMAPTTRTALKLNPTCSNDVRICEGGGYTFIFNGAYVGSDLTVAHDAIVTHNITAANDMISSHNVTAVNDISATHDLNASNNANIANLLKVGGTLQSNSSVATIGQSVKGNPALTLTDNGNTPNQDYFKVYGNGYTEINIFNPSTTARALAIRDNTKDLFVVKSNGKAYAREMEISNLTTFPDYVFNSEYKLKPIAELDRYIQQNKHLPGFEKGSYYEQNGINVNDMFVKQQEKIEELTLYIIQLEKRLQTIEGQK